jgi:hypothetical protein
LVVVGVVHLKTPYASASQLLATASDVAFDAGIDIPDCEKTLGDLRCIPGAKSTIDAIARRGAFFCQHARVIHARTIEIRDEFPWVSTNVALIEGLTWLEPRECRGKDDIKFGRIPGKVGMHVKYFVGLFVMLDHGCLLMVKLTDHSACSN